MFLGYNEDMKKSLSLCFLGPQGCGKGTQVALLQQDYGYHVLGMGQALRDLAAEDSPLGMQVKAIHDQGTLVPNEITIEILRRELAKLNQGQGIILDGFPRNMGQAETLATILPLNAAVEFDITAKVAVERLLQRLMCPKGHIYNLQSNPPKQAAICNLDGLTLHRRDDDTEEAIKQRLEIYYQETAKVLDYYRSQGKLITINGDQPIADVYQHLLVELNKL